MTHEDAVRCMRELARDLRRDGAPSTAWRLAWTDDDRDQRSAIVAAWEACDDDALRCRTALWIVVAAIRARVTRGATETAERAVRT